MNCADVGIESLGVSKHAEQSPEGSLESIDGDVLIGLLHLASASVSASVSADCLVGSGRVGSRVTASNK